MLAVEHTLLLHCVKNGAPLNSNFENQKVLLKDWADSSFLDPATRYSWFLAASLYANLLVNLKLPLASYPWLRAASLANRHPSALINFHPPAYVSPSSYPQRYTFSW